MWTIKPNFVISPQMIGGVIFGIGIIVASVTKIMTRNYITKDGVSEEFQSKEICGINTVEIKQELTEIKADQKIIMQDIKEILKDRRK